MHFNLLLLTFTLRTELEQYFNCGFLLLLAVTHLYSYYSPKMNSVTLLKTLTTKYYLREELDRSTNNKQFQELYCTAGDNTAANPNLIGGPKTIRLEQ